MPLHIIIAEDEADVRNFLVRALARIKPDATVSAVDNGRDALRVFQQHGGDLIISDYRMPGMNGLDLLAGVRRISTIPFIMISADALVGQQAQSAGVTLFLDKPLGLYTLRDAVLQYLP